MGTTTYPHGKAEDSREVGRGSLPSAYILVVPNNEGPLFEMLQQFLSAGRSYCGCPSRPEEGCTGGRRFLARTRSSSRMPGSGP
jgi:hypothetical protein